MESRHKTSARTAPFSVPPTSHLVAFSPDGKAISARCTDGAIYKWESATGRQTSYAFAQQGSSKEETHGLGRRSVSVGANQLTRPGTSQLRRGHSGHLPLAHVQRDAEVYCPDGQTLITQTVDQKVWIMTRPPDALGPPLIDPRSDRFRFDAYFSARASRHFKQSWQSGVLALIRFFVYRSLCCYIHEGARRTTDGGQSAYFLG